MPGPLSTDGSRRRRKQIGHLRERVRIEKLADDLERDAAGAEIPEWEEVATVFASVEPLAGRELMAEGQVQANQTYLVEMRGRAGVTPKNRLVWVTGGDRVLNIVSAPPATGASGKLVITCLEEV